MNLVRSAQCGSQEITNLATHSTALDAMKAFCKATLETTNRYTSSNYTVGYLYANYIFSEALKNDGKPLGARNYGMDFAKFIKEHELGEVVWGPPARNVSFHPDHANQIFVWAPDPDALRTWYTKSKEAPKPKEPRIAQYCPSCRAELDDEGLCLEGCDEDFYPDEFEDDEDDEDPYANVREGDLA